MSSDGRFGSIQGLLASKPATSGQVPLRVVDAADEPIDEKEPAPPTPQSGRSSSAEDRSIEKRSAASDGGLARVGVRLPPELYAGLVARANATGQSHGNVVLDAIEDAHTNQVLESLLAPKGDDGGGLFARTQTRGLAEARVPVEIRLRVKAVEQLDNLVRSYGAASRTALILAALEYHLPPARDQV